MKKPGIAAILALTTGIAGGHRLYLGQYFRAFLYIIYPFTLITLLFTFSGTLGILREQLTVQWDFSSWFIIAPFWLLPLLDAVWLGTRNKTSFGQRYPQEASLVKAFGAVLAGAVWIVALYAFFWQAPQRSVDAEAAFKGTVEAFSEAYAKDFTSFEGATVQLTGTITEEEMNLSADRPEPVRTLILGEAATPVKCIFTPASQAIADTLAPGSAITVKGVCRADFAMRATLEQCDIMAVAGTPVATE